MGTNLISGTADRLRRCQLRCNKLVTVVDHQFIALTVDICAAQWMGGTASRGSVNGSGGLVAMLPRLILHCTIKGIRGSPKIMVLPSATSSQLNLAYLFLLFRHGTSIVARVVSLV